MISTVIVGSGDCNDTCTVQGINGGCVYRSWIRRINGWIRRVYRGSEIHRNAPVHTMCVTRYDGKDEN